MPSVSNDAESVSQRCIPACLIGEAVLLVHGSADSEWQVGPVGDERGRIELAVADHEFTVLLFGTPVDPGAIDDGVSLVDDLPAFAGAAGLARGEYGQLLSRLLGPVAGVFGLTRDPRFVEAIRQSMAAPGLPRGRLTAETVSGFDTLLLHLPRSFGLAPDDLLVSAQTHVAVGTVKAVRDWLGGGRDGRIAVVELPSTLAPGPFLAVSPRGLAVIDLDFERHDGTVDFHARHHRTSPELVSLLALSDREAAAELAVLGRRSVISDTVEDSGIGFHLELTDVLPMPHGLFVHGWFFDADQRLRALTAVDYGLRETSVTRAWHMVPATVDTGQERRRVHLFSAFLPRRKGSPVPGNTAFRLDLAGGERHLLQAPAGLQEDHARRARILDSIVHYDFPPDVFRRIHKPALEPVQAAIVRRQGVRRSLSLGTVSARTSSIVVPLYRETRFIRSQLMAFARDTDIRNGCEIVYVVDDPLIALKVEQELRDSAEIHPLDIRLVTLERNGGYALANNFGVGEARGETIVLMNSDVVPEGPGWLRPLTERLAAMPSASVVGPKLLYADGSLQHAGMYFHRQPNGRWQNMHHHKGYGRDFPPANIERDVPAVTGALMVLAREDYLAVGGLDARYVIGDYEDSDLCLKLRARGGRCRYVPQVALLHCERQSMPGGAEAGPARSTLYNEALHGSRWSSAIEALMAEFSEAAHGE